MRNLILLMIAILFSTCSKNEIKREYYQNGQIKEVIPYKGDLMHGEYSAYFENGQLRAQGIYIKGKMIGTWKYWYKSGTQMSEAIYEGNQLVNMQFWDKEGTQTITDCSGTAVMFYSNGNQMSQLSYSNCLMHGEWTTWFEDGQIESRFYYDKGIPIGVWKFWNPDGTLRKTENHD